MEKSQKIKKVNLSVLISVLMDIYNQGVDFVDIYGVVEEREDTVGISFSKSYMNENYTGNFDKFQEEEDEEEAPEIKKVIKLSDEDLNKLI